RPATLRAATRAARRARRRPRPPHPRRAGRPARRRAPPAERRERATAARPRSRRRPASRRRSPPGGPLAKAGSPVKATGMANCSQAPACYQALTPMARPDDRLERQIETYSMEVTRALGSQLLCLAVYGSAAGSDFFEPHSDVNVAVVVPAVTIDVLEMLAPVVMRWEKRRFATPLLIEQDFLQRARDAFPMELDDIRRQHRLLAGTDLLTGVTVDPGAVRRQCEKEARGKLLRLRALYLATAGAPSAHERLMLESLKSILIFLRHLLHLQGHDAGMGYREVLAKGQEVLGPLPLMARLLDH